MKNNSREKICAESGAKMKNSREKICGESGAKMKNSRGKICAESGMKMINSRGKICVESAMKKFLAIIFLCAIFFSCSSDDNAADFSHENFSVTIAVNVESLCDNIHLLAREKHELVPADGIIFPATIVSARPGENVFDVLKREMRNAGIHMVTRQTLGFESAYVEAINNIFEFDAGALSGWKYRANGEFPSFGASAYILQPDDFIEWIFTVDLGREFEQSFE
ncbi:MAG: DUF4430 domain-containing protein [Defluviitaleaceae bacterium]|nr:DUF4430 domain-containing protein [Defluviitaleaceae bacterium]